MDVAHPGHGPVASFEGVSFENYRHPDPRGPGAQGPRGRGAEGPRGRGAEGRFFQNIFFEINYFFGFLGFVKKSPS